MVKILGLHLGTNSIGWAVVDKGNNKIIDAGVRIFKAGSSNIGQGDNEKSNNAERREFRQVRKEHYRKRLRKSKLLRVLIDNDMCPLAIEELNRWKNWDKRKKTAGKRFPDSPVFVEWLKMNPYRLRAMAVNENVSRHEFGRILYHIIQRRGFLSSRKGTAEGVVYKGAEATRRLMDGKTLGHKLHEILPEENKPYKRLLDDEGNELRIRRRYTLREMYVEEIDRIWQKQAEHMGLNDIHVATGKEIILEGKPGSERYQKKLNNIKARYGKKNIKTENKRVIVMQSKPFKEFLAGRIENSDDGIQFKSNESVLFWQRPLRPKKGLLVKCIYENRLFYDKTSGRRITVGASPCPVSHPEYELFRAYQFINNITFGSQDNRLNDVQKLVVLDLINKNDNDFDFEKVSSALNLSYERLNYEKKFKAPANPTHKRIKSFFSQEQWKNHGTDIWHCFYFYEDKEHLAEKLIRSYGLSVEKAKKAANEKLEEGYGSVSLKAIRNIFPFLERGFPYSLAVLLGGVKNAFGDRWDRFEGFHSEIINKVKEVENGNKFKALELVAEIKKILSDPDNNYGFFDDDKAFRKLYHHSLEVEKKKPKLRLPEIEDLGNPIVQKGLNETRRLVNELLDKYSAMPQYRKDFKFDKIHVELGREFRSGKKQRQDIDYMIRKNESANAEAKMNVVVYGLKPGRENITKYRLFEEIENRHKPAVCPYTNRAINLADLLVNNNTYQVEHILPYSVCLDDSLMNKTLCESGFNRLKGELTPYEFYLKNSDPQLWNAGSWEEIERRAYSILPYMKAKRFTIKERPKDMEFINRQLSDTRYISIKAANILKVICHDVMVIPGQMTSELRRLWGLNNIIQPVIPLYLNGYKLDEVKSLPHYVILNQDGEPSEISPILADRPETKKNQILLPCWHDGRKNFIPDLGYQQLKLKIDAGNLPKGKYWAKVNISDPARFTPVLTKRPDTRSDSIAYRGRVSDKKFFNESLTKKLNADLADGVYWGIFKVMRARFFKPEKGKQPKVSGNQVLLYGEVKDNGYSSFIYRCKTKLEPGKFWAVLDLDFKTARFIPAINKPETSENKLYIDGTIDVQGLFASDCDPEYKVKTDLKPGKYYAIISIISYAGVYPVVNPKPELMKGESIIEGNVWVNNQTGEIMFDPKKNRDDQRHHSINAITVALTDRKYLQKLSQYYGEYKDKERGVGDRPDFAMPWTGFDRDVKEAVDKILVSYSRNSKVYTRISKAISKAGKSFRSVGYAARGRLHREYFFGRHPNPVPYSKGDENGIKFEIGKDGDPVYYYHIRKPLTSIQNNKHISKIVDHGIRELIQKRLRGKFNVDTSGSFKIPDNFFFDDNNNPLLFLPNKNGEPLPVRKIRMREFIGKAVQIKDGINKWVNPYNNHHVVIYQTETGELKDEVISLWEVIERVQQGGLIYRLPEDGISILTTLHENDMFLLKCPHDIIINLRSGIVKSAELSKYLYRVQKIAGSDTFLELCFRHHLDSRPDSEAKKDYVYIKGFGKGITGWGMYNPIKVRINLTGDLFII